MRARRGGGRGGSDIEEAIQGRSVRLCGVWASCLISDALEKMWAP